MYATLYARSLNGRIKVWYIETRGDRVLTRNGLFGRDLASHSSDVTMSSPNAEFMSKLKKKKKEGYKDMNDIISYNSQHNLREPVTITKEWLDKWLPTTNLDNNYNLKPMKCQKFKKGKMKYPALAQPKLNGVRATLRWEVIREDDGLFETVKRKAVLRSKLGLIYYLPHITDSIEYSFFIDTETGKQVAYDGEIYKHGLPINVINSASPLINDNGTIPNSTRYAGITANLQFVVFDIANEDMPQKQRLDIVESVVPFNGNRFVDSLIADTVYNDDEVAEVTMKYIAQGYEGAVIRNMDAEYNFGGRPMTMMKSKHFQDAEFEVVDVIAKPKEPETGLFVLKNDINDNLFECVPMGTYVQRKEYLDNKHLYIGKYATVKFYERSGVNNVPFHANVITIRKDE